MPYVDHQAQRYARDHEYGDGGADNRHERQVVFGLQQYDRGEHAEGLPLVPDEIECVTGGPGRGT
jgi:hypothetical protein